jgi:hypothetical protein
MSPWAPARPVRRRLPLPPKPHLDRPTQHQGGGLTSSQSRSAVEETCSCTRNSRQCSTSPTPISCEAKHARELPRLERSRPGLGRRGSLPASSMSVRYSLSKASGQSYVLPPRVLTPASVIRPPGYPFPTSAALSHSSMPATRALYIFLFRFSKPTYQPLVDGLESSLLAGFNLGSCAAVPKRERVGKAQHWTSGGGDLKCVGAHSREDVFKLSKEVDVEAELERVAGGRRCCNACSSPASLRHTLSLLRGAQRLILLFFARRTYCNPDRAASDPTPPS